MATNSVNIGLGIDDSNFLTSLHKDLNDFTKITRLMETAGQIEVKVKAASTQKIVSDFKSTINKINKLKGSIGTYNQNTPLQTFKFSELGKSDISTIKNAIKTLNKDISNVKVTGGVNKDVKQTIELLQKAVDLAATFRNEANKLSMVAAKGQDNQVAKRIKEYERVENAVTKLKANLKDVSKDSSITTLQKQLSQLSKIANAQRSADASLKTDIYTNETKAIEAEIAKIEEYIAVKKREAEVRQLNRKLSTQARNYQNAKDRDDLTGMRNAKSKEAAIYENQYNRTGEQSARLRADAARNEVAAIQGRIEARKKENEIIKQAVLLETKAKQIKDTISATGDKSITDLKKRVTLSNQLVETYKKLQQLTGIDYSKEITHAKNTVNPYEVRYNRDSDNIKNRINVAQQNKDLEELRKAQLAYARLNERMAGFTGNDIYLQEAKSAREAAKATKELISIKQKETKIEEMKLKSLNKLRFAEQDYAQAQRRNTGKNVAQYNSEIMALQKLIAAKRTYLRATGNDTNSILQNAEIKNLQEKLLLLRQHKDALLAQNKAYSLQKSLLGSLRNLATRYFGLYAVINFAKKMAETVGYFQQQKVALEAITQDVQKANTIFQQLQDFSVKSPFQFRELVSFTKQLSAFQIPTDELFDTTKKLADISAGLGVDMQRIILAYGQVRSASVLRGQELRQFTEAGIPLVDELAKKFSILEGRIVSTNEVFKRISERQVSFEMVKDILFAMTEEGGRFNDMQEKLSQTTYGQLMNLKDAWTIALNDIGKSNSGIINGILKLFRAMIDNWRTTLSTILGFLGGTLINVAIGKITAQAVKLRIQLKTIDDVLKVVRISARKMGVALKSALVSTGIGALLTVVGLLIGRLVEAAHKAGELKRGLADIDKNASLKISELVTNFGKLTKALQSAAEGSEEERKVYEKLLATYSEYLPKQDLELENLRNLTDGYNKLTSAIIAKVRAQAEEEKRDSVMHKVGNDIDKAVDTNLNLDFIPIEDEMKRLLIDELKEGLTNNITLPQAELKSVVKTILEKYLKKFLRENDINMTAAGIVYQATRTRNKYPKYFGLAEDNSSAYKAALEQGYIYDSEEFRKYVSLYQQLQRQQKKTEEAVRNEIKSPDTSVEINGQKTANKTILRQLRDAELFEGAMQELGIITGKIYNFQSVKSGIESGDVNREKIVSSVDKYINRAKGDFSDPAVISLLEGISTTLQRNLVLYEKYEDNVNGYLDNLVKSGSLNNGLSSLFSRFYMSPQTDLTEYVKNLQTEYDSYKQHLDKQIEKDPSKIKDKTLSQRVSEDINGMNYLKTIAKYLNVDLDAKKSSGGSNSVSIQSELSDFISSLKKAYETYKNATQKGGVEMGLGYVRNDIQLKEMFGEFFGGKDSEAFKKLDNVKIGNKSVSTMIQDKFISGGLEDGIMDFESAAKKVAKELMAYYEDDTEHRAAFKNAANELLKWIDSTIAKDNLNVALEKLEKEVNDLTLTFNKRTKNIDLYRKLVKNGTQDTLGNTIPQSLVAQVQTPASELQLRNIREMFGLYNSLLNEVSNGKGQPFNFDVTNGDVEGLYAVVEELREQRLMNKDNFGATVLGQTGERLEKAILQLIDTITSERADISGEQYTGDAYGDLLANVAMRTKAGMYDLTAEMNKARANGVYDYKLIGDMVKNIKTDANSIFDSFINDSRLDVVAKNNFGKIDFATVKKNFENSIKDLPEELKHELLSKVQDLEIKINDMNAANGALSAFGDAVRMYRNAETTAKEKYSSETAYNTDLQKQLSEAQLNGDAAAVDKLNVKLTSSNELLKQMGENGENLAVELKNASIADMEGSLQTAQRYLDIMSNAVTSVVSAFKALSNAVNKVYDIMNDGENPDWMQDMDGFLQDFADDFEALIAPIGAVIAMVVALTVAFAVLGTEVGIAMAAIVAVIAVAAAIMAAFQQHDRALEHDIESLNKQVEGFENAAKNLNAAAERQVGLQRLQTRIDAVGQSLSKASAEAAKAAKEDEKKDTDEDKLRQYQQASIEAMNEFKNGLRSMIEDITSSTDNWASAMGDAIRSAFQNGENAARAFRNTVKDMIGDVVENMLEMSVLQPVIDNALENWTNQEALQNKHTYNVKDKETGATISKLDADGYMEDLLKNIGDADKAEEFYKTMLKLGDTLMDVEGNLPQFLREALWGSSSSSSLSGGIESITEDTARRLEALSNSQLGELVLIRSILQDYIQYGGLGGSPIADIQTALVQMNNNVAMLVNISNMIQNHIHEMRYTSVQPLHVTMV